MPVFHIFIYNSLIFNNILSCCISVFNYVILQNLNFTSQNHRYNSPTLLTQLYFHTNNKQVTIIESSTSQQQQFRGKIKTNLHPLQTTANPPRGNCKKQQSASKAQTLTQANIAELSALVFRSVRFHRARGNLNSKTYLPRRDFPRVHTFRRINSLLGVLVRVDPAHNHTIFKIVLPAPFQIHSTRNQLVDPFSKLYAHFPRGKFPTAFLLV